MAIEIKMPALSPTMEEGTLAKWLVADGDEVRSGDVIAEIETDKATMEVEAIEDGKVGRILVPAGTQNVKVNAVIAVLLEDGETSSDIKAVTPDNTATVTSGSETTAPESTGPESTVPAAISPAPVAAADANGVGASTMLTVRESLRDAMAEEMRRDENVFIMGEEVAEYQGAYKVGGQMGCPIVFRGPNGAASRVAAQHSQCFASWYAHCPGLKVVAPYSAADAKGLLKAAIRDPNPVIFLEHEVLYGQSFEVPDDDDWIVPIGKANILRTGSDVTIVAFSIMVGRALEAADRLAEQGISAEVIDLRSIRPLDTATIVASVKKTSRLVTCEEGFPFAGIGAEIAMQVMEQAFDWLDAPIARVTGKDVPMPYAANLEALALPQVDDIIATAKATCDGFKG
ncbi:MAG: biotin/lipoyl-binding protein [Alphaproteobacteria bacterium]|nr:biotin/lipoyl-binding protein [Alphaproteobacteria bacterium]